ncbi:hypothetical protein GUJ93_ZPchr0012g19919 [Zizania palustris]|uniref:C2 NT-type domain-containing protein n=1 Tax=Zizania palustris TaxID=103762 RepID=A0A8J5WKR6_ZIZPA|nr:hypothetical protein GUJ93_ZPchr0012g19919 [Zizania palustris]KAG8092451.1 hypothetical protein GUJ93_ZPchr0012g19919 [Zizania palustris]
MSKLNRRGSSDRIGERVEFRFSSFLAVQVPVVSDRLILSIVLVDTGKTIAKSTKAAARNGICQWPDSILEQIWFSQDEVSKEFEECQCRFVVSMGSTKNGILGEVLLNLTNYLSSLDSTTISLPLKRCNSGTVLQLNIQCLGTKSETSPTNDDMECPSSDSDSMLNRTAYFLSGNNFDCSYQDEAGNMDANHSGDSVTDRTNLSQSDNLNDGLYMKWHNSTSPDARDVSLGHVGLAHLSSEVSDTSKDIIDNAEDIINGLRDEAKKWERKSRKLKYNLETMKKECAEKSKQQSELAQELSASNSEKDSLRHEIEELKCSLEEVMEHKTISGTPRSGDTIELQKEMKDEAQFLKESNANLTAQLKKTQEANIELVSILQELEETIEVQRVEISNLSHMSDLIDHEVSKNEQTVQEDTDWARKMSLKEDEIAMLRENLDRILTVDNTNGEVSDAIYLELEKENDFLKVKIQELEKDCSELTEENLELIYKLKEVSGVAKGEDPCIPNSEDDLSDGSTYKVKYLETKCADLELKLLKFSSESSELEEKLQKSHNELKERALELSELREKLSCFHDTEMEEGDIDSAKSYKMGSEKLDDNDSGTDLDVLRSRVLLKEQEIESLQDSKKEMENFISQIQNEKNKLEEHLAASLKECSITSNCLDEVREELVVLTNSVDSHVSTNKFLETKISELEICKVNLELHISKLEHENVELSDFISGLETQLTYLTSEMELSMVQMDDSRSLITNLKDKLEQQQAEVEAQKLELKQNQLESHKMLSEVQEDSEALRKSNAKLQATIDHVVEERNALQTLTTDLQNQKLEILGYASHIEQELEQSKRKTVDFCKALEFLEAKLSSLQKDISLKEQYLLSELDNVFQEHKEHEERINHAHFLLNKIEKEKTVEVSNLEREVMSLTAQVCSTQKERESATLDTIHEVSVLQADKAKLEANLEHVNAQMIHYESQLEDLCKESENKIKGLVDSLNMSKQNEEMLATDVDHMRRLIEAARSNEDNLRKTSGELELKLKSSYYEKEQILEEISGLKIQAHKIAGLQDEVLTLQSSLDKAKFEKEKLEELLQSSCEECEELKVQKAMLADKVSCMQGILNVANEGKQTEISIQTKLAMLEDDPSAKEANSEYQEKISSLEKEIEDLARRSQILEKQLELKTTQNKDDNINKQGNDDNANENGDPQVIGGPELQSKIQLLETKLAKALEENKLYSEQLKSTMPEVKSCSKDGRENNDNRITQLESELKDMKGNDDNANENGDSQVIGCSELQSKIRLLETKLAEALEENKLYSGQLKCTMPPEEKSGSKDVKENNDDRISQLESELKDMKDRLLNMSLQYAEVEEQREQLVLELKTATAKKGRWF